MNIETNNNVPVKPFEDFSLEHSTSFSAEHDEATAAQFEEHKLTAAPKNLQQKHMEQCYSKYQLHAMSQNENQPLKRKPFVFEKNGEQITITDHFKEIRSTTQKNA